MKFHYTALTGSGQKVEGVMEAESLESAKSELHKMELSIVETHLITDEEFALEKTKKNELKEAGVSTFIFRGTDPAGKPVEGSIEARSDDLALRRLIQEYHFKIDALEAEAISEEEKKASAGRLLTLLKELEAQGITPLANAKPKEEEWDETLKGLDENIIREVDKIIGVAKKVMTDHAALFTPEKLSRIKKTVDELERVRTSNNLRHIAEISNQVFELIDAPDSPMTAGKMATDAAYREAMSGLEKSDLLKKEMGIHTKAVGLARIRATFDRLKKQLTFLGKKSKKSPAPESAPPREPGFKKMMFCIRAFLKASNPLTKKTRKRDLVTAWKEWNPFRGKKTPAAKTGSAVPIPPSKPETARLYQNGQEAPKTAEKRPKPGHDFGPLLMEADSFISWLLCFYLLYFFLVSFSLEKGLGLPESFTAKTLRSPLIFNITFFLFVTHFLLRLKTRRFHQNILGSLFLFFFGYGLLALILFNF